jgi:hypothetical protein
MEKFRSYCLCTVFVEVYACTKYILFDTPVPPPTAQFLDFAPIHPQPLCSPILSLSSSPSLPTLWAFWACNIIYFSAAHYLFTPVVRNLYTTAACYPYCLLPLYLCCLLPLYHCFLLLLYHCCLLPLYHCCLLPLYHSCPLPLCPPVLYISLSHLPAMLLPATRYLSLTLLPATLYPYLLMLMSHDFAFLHTMLCL